ncbi:MAG: cytochrome c [Acidobacteria bacterium]|nr:cytochrome c [Acidobacteriota bacterium]
MLNRVSWAMLLSSLAAPAAQVTYTRHIAAILQKNCQACHRPGEVAPMSFTNYREVRPWAKAIRAKVVARQMPPWFADPKHGDFLNDARLPQKDIDAINTWVEAGAPEGNPKDMPAQPVFIDGWNIGKPDAVFTMTSDFEVPTEGAVPYKYFAIPTNLNEDKYVQFAEIRAGDRAHVHHVIVSVRYPEQGSLPAAGEITSEARAALARDAQRAANPDGRLVGWAPGEAPLILRPGQAKLIKKGSVLILQVHYTTNGKPGRDRSSVGVVYSKEPVEKRVITAGAVGRNLVIPPHAPHHETTATFTFKDDSHIDSLHPHMHLRGKDFLYRLVYPDGASKTLLSVPRFDFAWQLTYFLREPIAAPAGSKLEVVAHHDNSANNRFNPDPTKEVKWGDQTWDEMMIGYFDYTLDKQNLRQPVQSSSGGQ